MTTNLNYRCLYLVIISIVFNTKAQNIEDDLLLHYSFSNNTLDSSSNNYHGNPSGIQYVSDRDNNINSAVYFDGIDDYIELPNVLELKPDFPISFSFMIKYDSDDYTDRAVFNTSFENDRSSGVYFNTQISTGNYAVNFGDGSFNYVSSARRSFVSNEAIVNNQWHHIAVVLRSATDMSIYVNCVDEGGAYSGSGGNLFYSNTPGSLGRRDRNLGIPAHYFKGSLDEFRYWDREITPAEIALLCNEVLSTEPHDEIESIATIYPNPAKDLIHIDSKINFDSIEIYNLSGILISKSTVKETLDVSNLEAGVYLIKLTNPDVTFTEKIVLH